MAKRRPYDEGTCFAIPLVGGGYALGVVARARPRRAGKILFAYFFGPKSVDVPTLADVSGLVTEEAITNALIGDLYLIEGSWPILGSLPDWKREEWPIPLFLHRESLTDRVWRVRYADDDPSELPVWEPATPEDEGLAQAKLWGLDLVEIRLTELLAD
jgi:hypothetical protein